MVFTIYSDTPNSYKEAINCPNKNNWYKAIQEELNNLYNNNIMSIVNYIPKNKNLISTKWVFATKKDSNNNIVRFTARLVARGFKQRRGIDYELTYSPTCNGGASIVTVGRGIETQKGENSIGLHYLYK